MGRVSSMARVGVKLPLQRSEFRAVDVDIHVNDTPQAVAPYCEMRWRKSLEHSGRMPQRYLDEILERADPRRDIEVPTRPE